MRRLVTVCGLLVLFVAASAPAQPAKPEPKPARHLWDAAYIEGVRSGYFHTAVEELSREGKPVIRTTVELNLKIRRYGEVVPLKMKSSTDETPEGKVLAVSVTQYLDKGQAVVSAGTVEGDKLVLRSGDKVLGALPWNDAAVGPHYQETLLAKKKVKAGDTLEYLAFEPGVMQAVKVKVHVKEPEEVDLLRVVKKDEKTSVERVTARLLRVDVAPGKVKIGEQEVPLPGLAQWVTAEYQTSRSQLELPGMGVITLYRTTEDVAKQEATGPQILPDLGLQTLITLNKPLDNARTARQAVFRVTVKGDDNAAGAFAQDGRQSAQKASKDTFELVTKAAHPGKSANPKEKREAFLGSSHFLDADSDKVKALAAKAVGTETDPWKKALAIEKWVHDNMKPTNAVGFASASQVAESLKGDCRQHAMLAAAMCRAAGVPSRTALGLVYVRDPDRGPVLGFHMWTEVLIGDEWRGLDAVFGQGGLTVGHVKINDHSWNDTQTLAPLLPVTRVMGKLKVEVVSVE